MIVVSLGLVTHKPADAQAVYRCVQKGKPVSFRTTPCEAGAKATKAVPYTPEAAPTADEVAWKRYRTEREMSARHEAQRASQAATGVVLPAGGSECARAKAERDAWERRVGLTRTVDSMRTWQEYVYRACR